MTLVDQAARDAIRTDLAATLVVEAAAGTGKTTEMIQRIIAVIATGTSTLSRIVAVTFTEKAAGEMKLRLRTELEDARKKANGRAKALLEGALAELETTRIGSIHSFCADLLRERPIEARIDPIFEVASEEEAEIIYTGAFERWFQTVVNDPPEGVRRLLRRTEPTEQLRRAGWALVGRRDFTGAWRRDPFDRNAMIDHVVTELANLGALARHARSPDDKLGRALARIDRWCAELVRREQVRERDHDGLEAELAAIARWWEWKDNGRGKLYGDELARADVLARRDATKAALDAFLVAAGADLAARLHDELRPLVAAYEETKARTGQLDFLDLLAKTRDLLRDDPGVRAELQQRFTHFFVDEFQDTDPLQVEVLLLLCADSPAVSDPTSVTVRPGKLFVVGDPKQAIYRFRRADIALYEAVKQRLKAQGAQLLHLSTSFRSVPSIQAAVNAAFAPVLTGGHQAAYVPLEKHREDITDRPTVVALPVPKPYRRYIANVAIEESYPDAVGAFMEWLLRASGWTVSERGRGAMVPIEARHVCLVFRRFQSFGRDLTRPYVRALEARGIPHVLVGGRSFHEREEIEAIRNALRAIEWPDDEFSIYATLRGPFFSLHDEDLLAFKHAHRRLHPLAWIDRVPNAPAPDLAPELLPVADALGILGRLHRRRNRRPIADTISQLLDETRAHAGIAIWPAGEQALANVFRVMDLARRFESAGATSFRAFIDRLDGDAERGKQPDAPVVEEGTEGTRIMTAHAAKGLEFPVVILCDPTAPLTPETPSRYVDSARGVWLEPLAGCVPVELAERAEDVIARDSEETERLTYVAVTRARDLLVVPVVGDEERPGWLEALTPIAYPTSSTKRTPGKAPGCPPFGDDSVVARSRDTDRMPHDSVAPGRHLPKAGTHSVVWWDPNTLALDRELIGGLRQQQILEADESNERATASERAHADWVARRASAVSRASAPTIVATSVTRIARTAQVAPLPVELHDTQQSRRGRPGGKRFGSLVHATLAAVDLRGTQEHVATVARGQARLLGASPAEIDAAIGAVTAALAHPLMVRAAAAHDAGTLRREVPVAMTTQRDGLVEGIVDLAFAETAAIGEQWIVVDFKTDAELSTSRGTYENQVRLYAEAITRATGRPTLAALLVV